MMETCLKYSHSWLVDVEETSGIYWLGSTADSCDILTQGVQLLAPHQETPS